MYFATNADDKFKATFLGKPSLSLYFRRLHFDEEPLRARRLFLEVIRSSSVGRARVGPAGEYASTLR